MVSVAWAVALSPLKARSLIAVALCWQRKGVTSAFYEVDSNSDKTFAIDYLEI
jgi:hypothetical protein